MFINKENAAMYGNNCHSVDGHRYNSMNYDITHMSSEQKPIIQYHTGDVWGFWFTHAELLNCWCFAIVVSCFGWFSSGDENRRSSPDVSLWRDLESLSGCSSRNSLEFSGFKTFKEEIWRFPEMGVPPVIIQFHGIFPNKSHPFGGTPMTMETPIFPLGIFSSAIDQPAQFTA